MHEFIFFDGVDLSGLIVALGGGLLVGLERERQRAWETGLAGGLRTSMLAALIGALSMLPGELTAALSAVLVGACVLVNVGLHGTVAAASRRSSLCSPRSCLEHSRWAMLIWRPRCSQSLRRCLPARSPCIASPAKCQRA